MKKQEEESLQDWYTKRRMNLIAIYFNTCLYQFEYSAISISALFYYTYTLKVGNPHLYYSLTMSAMFLFAPISPIIVGKYTDRTRQVRKAALILSLFNIAGNLLYALPFFTWLPIVGRILCGIPDGIKAAYYGMNLLFLLDKSKLLNAAL